MVFDFQSMNLSLLETQMFLYDLKQQEIVVIVDEKLSGMIFETKQKSLRP